MNEDVLKGKWKQLKGKAQQQWGKLTNDDLDRIQGRREELVGVVQERYGYERAEAEREVDEFLDDLD
ncbi:MAG TPA: CsbD family protein [Anaerolineae bacterium]